MHTIIIMVFCTLLNPHRTCRCGQFVTVRQEAKKLSVIMNPGGRHMWKDRLLAVWAVQFRRLGQWTDQQMKKHERQMEKALLQLFITIRPLPVWRLLPECLAVGESSTEGNKNPNVLPGRRESEVAEKRVGFRLPTSSIIWCWRTFYS